MNILNYSRDQIQKLIQDGICEVQALRDWDIANSKKNGESVGNIAHDNNLSRWQVRRVLNKLDGKTHNCH